MCMVSKHKGKIRLVSGNGAIRKTLPLKKRGMKKEHSGPNTKKTYCKTSEQLFSQ